MSKKHTRQGQTDYHYDRTGRIESCRNQAYWETLQYDAAANLLDKRRNQDSSTDNQNLIRFNQLLHFRGLQYTYDAHGRTHSKQTASGTQYYHYDAEHRLTEVRIEKQNRTERYGYVYDALGRRIEKHQIDRAGKACNRTRFLWDGLRMIQETRTDRSKSVYIYTDESGYEPLARVETTTGTEQKVLYYHTDVNGAPEELTDEDGHIVWACSYQLWGKPIQEIEHSQIQQNLRYQGQYLDRETGLHYNTFRYYDPDIGRFTQPDPIGLLGGFNLYQYAPNSLMWIDPWGLVKLIYEDAPYHGKKDNLIKSRAPTNGQIALDNSIQVKVTSFRRVGVDVINKEFVVLDRTIVLSNGNEIFHGHVREWSSLHPDQQKALNKSGMADKKGNIKNGC